MTERIQIDLPPALTLEGWKSRGKIWVGKPGKPPKLRFQPGSFVRYKGKIYEIIYAYRTQENPQEWLYACVEGSHLEERNITVPSILDIVEAFGAGDHTPRVVYELFRDTAQALSFFSDIPLRGDVLILSNKKLVQKGELVSSGKIVS